MNQRRNELFIMKCRVCDKVIKSPEYLCHKCKCGNCPEGEHVILEIKNEKLMRCAVCKYEDGYPCWSCLFREGLINDER